MLCICEAFSGNIHPSSSFQPRTPHPFTPFSTRFDWTRLDSHRHTHQKVVGWVAAKAAAPTAAMSFWTDRGQLEWLEFIEGEGSCEGTEARNCLCDIHIHIHIPAIACSISYGRAAKAKTEEEGCPDAWKW